MSASTIIRIDDIKVAPGCRDRFVELLRSRYLPGAEARGLELVDIVLTPPFDTTDGNAGVVITWRLADIDSFWRTRRASMTDPTAASFWADTADIVVGRTRRFAQPSVSVTPIDPSPGARLPTDGVHHIALLHLLDEAAHVVVDAVHEVRSACYGRHLAGSVGGVDASWEFDADGPVAIDALSAEGADVVDVVVLGDVVGAGARAPALRDLIKRTLLLKVDDTAAGTAINEFERDLLAMPRHIPAIRNWRLAHVADSTGGWTHCWEQEYADLSGLRDDYMRSPFHWGLVDGWFDPEDPRCIVASELVHVFFETPSSVLAPSPG